MELVSLVWMRLYGFNPDFQVSSIEAVRSGPRRPKKNDRLRPPMLRASLWRWGWCGTRSAEPTSWRLAGKCCARFGTMERIEPSRSESQWREMEFRRIAATLSVRLAQNSSEVCQTVVGLRSVPLDCTSKGCGGMPDEHAQCASTNPSLFLLVH